MAAAPPSRPGCPSSRRTDASRPERACPRPAPPGQPCYARAMEDPAPLAPERGKVKRLLLGKPRDIADPNLFQHLTLAAFLAWVGLGADGLSSSSYGPEEAFKALGP